MTINDPARASRLGRRSRNKGASFERLIAIELREVFGPQVRRGLGQARNAGEVPDIDGTPYWCECKHQHRPNIARAMLQAVRDSRGRKPPLVISRADNEPVFVTMGLGTFIQLVQTQKKEINDDGKPSTEGSTKGSSQTAKTQDEEGS
jgi:hypothetical protein